MVATAPARASELGLPNPHELWSLLERFNVASLHQRYPAWRSNADTDSRD